MKECDSAMESLRGDVQFLALGAEHAAHPAERAFGARPR